MGPWAMMVALCCPLSFCSTHVQPWRARRCVSFPRRWPDVLPGIQSMMLSSAVCAGVVEGGLDVTPASHRKKMSLFSYSAVSWFPSRRICPWKAFYLGDTGFLLLLFHVQLILMQHLLIQKHSVLQAKKKLSLLCQILASGQVVKRWNYFALTFLFDRMCGSALCREELSLIGVVVLRNNLSVQLFSEALFAYI